MISFTHVCTVRQLVAAETASMIVTLLLADGDVDDSRHVLLAQLMVWKPAAPV